MPGRGPRWAICCALVAACFLGGNEVLAERPVLLLVLTATEDAAAEREQRLRTELALTLDGFDVRAVESGDVGFPGLALSDKLALIQLWVDRNGAVATTWVEEAPSGQVLLHLVALATGRALVRIVEAERGPDTEAELALAARELLGEAYLFGPATGDPAVEQVVSAVQAQVAPPPTAAPPVVVAPSPRAPTTRPEPVWGVLPLARVGGGLYGHRGPHLQAGGGLAVERRLGSGGFARLMLGAAGGPRGTTRDGLVTGLVVEPVAALGYAWTFWVLSLGPVVELAAPWSRLELALGAGDPQQFGWWGFRAALGIELRLELTPALGLVAGWNAGGQARQEEFERRSDGSTVLETPIIDWRASAGLILRLGGG
jgi:hypothetical protein